jgi:integrase
MSILRNVTALFLICLAQPDGAGGWRPRRGRAPEGYLDRRAAERAMDALIDETERALVDVFEYGTRADTFALPANPVRGADKRREDCSKPPETFTAEQVMALARAAREGRHVNGGRRWASKEEDAQQQLANEQDAAIYTVAGFAGLRQGELRAIRWKHVRFADRTIVIVAGMSAGLDSTTKYGSGGLSRSRARRSSPWTS